MWIEPQCGVVQTSTNHKAAYMNSLEFHQLLDEVSNQILLAEGTKNYWTYFTIGTLMSFHRTLSHRKQFSNNGQV